ncbi:MAG: carboxypeptidase-like regulatory domain-containing protein, partial [Flavobacteriaceae bacterium]|nr:carboxypeptidase-like regulatory domain-containing protein [Flavobacteriaceae bacterium]
MRQATFLLTFLFSIQSFSQIIGNVKDTNANPLAFVNIYLEGTYIGTTSNNEGNYELNISDNKPFTIVFKYLGYKTLKKELDINTFPYTLNVSLEEETLTLDEVIINSNENPANRIIRHTINNRKTMLENIKSYKADFYSRGLIRIKNAPEKILGQEIGDLGGGLDSTRSGIIYLSETISKIEYQRPDKLKEKIMASKVSGDDNGFSFNNASDVDYNFYNNTVELGNQIVSPIADYAFNYYHYKLEGVFYDDRGNLINKIKVIPKRENDRIFSGTIYIVEDQWYIYALELDITGQQAQIPAADIITLKQTFTFSEKDKLWALISQSIDFKYGIFGIKGDGRFTAVYSAYNFTPNFSKKTFTKEVLSFADQANKKDSTYWNTIRPVPLTNEESNDYVTKDSIQVVRKSKTYLDSIDTKNNKFKLPNILFGYNYQNSFKDWNLNLSSPFSSLNFNTVQGYNSQFTIYYRKNLDEFRRYFSANTSLNYGVDDKRLRVTTSITYKFNNISRPFITLSGGVTTQQFNASQPISPLVNSISTLFFEDNYMKLYDKSFAQISYSQEWFNGLRFYSSLSYEKRKALFNRTNQVFYNDKKDAYTSNNPLDETAFGFAPFITHNILKLNVSARINFGQEYLSYPDSKFNIPNSKYPTLFLAYEKGFSASNTSYN